MTFDLSEFTRRVNQDNPKYRQRASSLNDLVQLIQKKASVAQIKTVLETIPADKVKAYEYSLRYLIDHYPNMVNTLDCKPESHTVIASGTTVGFEACVQGHDIRGDLLYGVHPARTLSTYKLSDGSKMTICDNYNNAAKIGTGLAFARQWDGTGVLGSTKTDVSKAINRVIDNPAAALTQHDLTNSRFRAYAQGLMQSRYSPADTIDLPDRRVQKDTHKTLEQIKAVNSRANKADLKQHQMAHAHFFKAVRRACKGGIAMVASSPEFVTKGAKVHFLLDGMGDLGKVTRKEFFNTCTPITSSELTFCFRYWDTLKTVVNFYLNGEQVKAPWESNWVANDANGKEVKANKEAWLRYGYYRQLTGRAATPFPSAWATYGATA